VQTPSKGAFHRELAELRRKIKTTQDETQEFDDDISQMKRQQQQLTMVLDQRQVTDSSATSHPPPGRGAKYCDEYVCLSVRLSAGVTPKTARLNFTKLFVLVACGRGSVPL